MGKLPFLSGRRCSADMPRDLSRPILCRSDGENECGHINIPDPCGGDDRWLSDVLARQLTTPPPCDLVQNEANLLVIYEYRLSVLQVRVEERKALKISGCKDGPSFLGIHVDSASSFLSTYVSQGPSQPSQTTNKSRDQSP
jgi:hypothetical protein